MIVDFTVKNYGPFRDETMDGIRVTDGVVYICPDCGYETVKLFQKPA